MRIDLSDLFDSNVLRQDAIEAKCHLIGVYCLIGVKVCHHHRGVYARIGASGSYAFRRDWEQLGECVVEPGLDAVGIGLYLPAVVVCAVVGEGDKVAHGGEDRESGKRQKKPCLMVLRHGLCCW